MASTLQPPNDCPNCLQEKSSVKIADGIASGGNHDHIDDFVLYATFSGPASIGQIVDTKAPDRHTASAQPSVSVRPVGRISDLDVLPLSEIKDERHVFLIDSEKTVSVDVMDLIRVCLSKQVESYAPGELFSTFAWIISILEGCIIFIDGNVVTLNPIMPCRRLNYSYSIMGTRGNVSWRRRSCRRANLFPASIHSHYWYTYMSFKK
ncbi:hypothetical protein ARMSODRAFT_470647 [Armillaria solidipes]|uniref:Uncharacterized protein n=1 Tax=Armillaria solidipes TaxID=1076256 RepID=A0A2H3BBF5_9AGAR|nr:hypothetical protein ARMSODRAFT_470647 [Armillaria solidipes]